jgi:hypothetical protein
MLRGQSRQKTQHLNRIPGNKAGVAEVRSEIGIRKPGNGFTKKNQCDDSLNDVCKKTAPAYGDDSKSMRRLSPLLIAVYLSVTISHFRLETSDRKSWQCLKIRPIKNGVRVFRA